MEVHMSNVPRDLDWRSLRSQLEPCMAELGIKYFDCEKLSAKPYAFVRFPVKQDGENFLRRHGEIPIDASSGLVQESLKNHGAARPRGPSKQQSGQPKPKNRARLRLMNAAIFCRSSERSPPDPFVLSSIRATIDQAQLRANAITTGGKPGQQQQHRHQRNVTTFQIKKLCCGYWDASAKHFCFVSEYSLKGRGQVKLTRRNMTARLEHAGLQLRVPLRSIFELIWSTDGMAVTLTDVPAFLSKLDDPLLLGMSSLTIKPTTSSRRGPNGPQWQQLPGLDSQHERVSSFCLVYFFVFDSQNPGLERSMAHLRDQEDLYVTRFNFTSRTSSVSFASAYEKLRSSLQELESRRQIPFVYLFSLQRLVTNGYLHPTTVQDLTDRLVAKFAVAKHLGKTRPPISVPAFQKLFNGLDLPSPNGPNEFDVDSIMSFLEDWEGRIQTGADPEAYMYADEELVATTTDVFKATVSPGRVVLSGPEREPMNRVLRKYPGHIDFFLRVQFGGDDQAELYSTTKVSLDRIFDHFKHTLSSGISIAGRLYKFLGSSHSALRSHSCWLSAPFIHGTQLVIPQTIVAGLGEFSKMRCPPRCAARIGQAFTEVPWAVPMKGIAAANIRDVERGGRVFSDGVGTISTDALQAVWKVLPASKGEPTCLQIRYGGAKGMLCEDPRLPGGQINIRPSMVKFSSTDVENLEICDVASKPIPLVLNRQVIKILEDLGAPLDWFMRLQEEKLLELRDVTRDVHNTAGYLTEKSVAKAVGLPRFIRQLSDMRLDYRREPLLRAIVEAVVLQELRLLKHKARIPVPLGVTLFGVLDEFGFLEANQVYVTYDASPDGRVQGRIGEGPVLVYRCPALHPGDVQKCTSVRVPAGHPLRRLSNCIVFSQRGDRDLPSKLAGGDLDGDIFQVIFDPVVVSPVKTEEPADYPRVNPLELDRDLELADMANFFIDYIRLDQLGRIAVKHMILADQRSEGTLDKDCKLLAELHSTAVDFSKTNRAPDMGSLPRMNRCRPDWLAPGPMTDIGQQDIDLSEEPDDNADGDDDGDDDGPRFQYYPSPKILGQLYRAVDEKLIWAENVQYRKPPGVAEGDFWEEFMANVCSRAQRLGYVRWARFEEEAHRLRDAYEGAIADIMRQFSEHPAHPLKELEVVVGIVGRKGYLTGRQRDRSVRLKDEFERISGWITKQMRRRTGDADHQAGQQAAAAAAADDQSVADSQADVGGTSAADALELCLACVQAGCTPTKAWSRRNEVASFRVVAAAAVVRELNALELARPHMRFDMGGGGFVGLRGGAPRWI